KLFLVSRQRLRRGICPRIFNWLGQTPDGICGTGSGHSNPHYEQPTARFPLFLRLLLELFFGLLGPLRGGLLKLPAGFFVSSHARNRVVNKCWNLGVFDDISTATGHWGKLACGSRKVVILQFALEIAGGVTDLMSGIRKDLGSGVNHWRGPIRRILPNILCPVAYLFCGVRDRVGQG